MNSTADEDKMLEISLGVLTESVDSQLVGGHHDGGVGDLSHQLCAQTSVQTLPPLLFVDQPQCLPE